MTIDRDTIIKWLISWAKPFGFHLAKETDDSKRGNYVQILPGKGADPYHGSIHYEVIKRNEQWFAEFHVELYKSQGRDDLEKKLDEAFLRKNEFMRGIIRDSHWGNRYWKSRGPVRTERDLQHDLGLLKNLIDDSRIFVFNAGTTNNCKNSASVAIKTLPLLEVLTYDLQVPNYQRGYCWRMEDVRRIMIDIFSWQAKHSSGYYNIGTIVLKNVSEKDYAIIDGQQRLTTFALFARLQLKDAPGGFALGKFELGENNKGQESIGYLVRARDVLQTLISKRKQPVLKRVSINVVRLSDKASDDLAYLFFNHTNSLGRKLTDYELLKGHHLRFIDTASESVNCSVAAQKTVEIWNRLRHPLEVANSSPGESGKTVLGKGEEEVLHKMLFRLREWAAGEAFSPWADDLPTHDLFHHFSTEDEAFDGVTSSVRTADYDSIVRDGPEFFNYAESYRWKFASYLQTASAGVLYANLRGHSNDVLFDIINALGFLFYDKFGEKYLPEALCCITYRVSEIRNKGRVMQKYVGATNIPGISQWAMPSILSSKINRSNHESILFPMLIDPARDYELQKPTQTMRSYWLSVTILMEKLGEMMELNAVRDRAKEIARQINEVLESQTETR